MSKDAGRQEGGPPGPSAGTEVARAARRLLAGGLVAFPTETVYGLGADAENPQAIARIYEAKGRPLNHPVIVHLAPGARLDYWASDVPPEASRLVQAFWPGPLTLILRRAARIPDTVSGGQDSIGLRCPSHPVAQALLGEFARLKGGQGGVAAPSANKFGHVSPTRADHVRAEFPELLVAGLQVLEGGQSEVGIESTILDLSRLDQGVGPVLLRPGHISARQLGDVLGTSVSLGPGKAAPRVSGALKAHYAPRTPLFLVERGDLAARAAEAARHGERLAAIVFDPAGLPSAPGVDWVRAPATAQAFAAGLYALLRQLDLQNYARILVEKPPRDDDWLAVNDRLGRAAAAHEAPPAQPSARGQT